MKKRQIPLEDFIKEKQAYNLMAELRSDKTHDLVRF